MATKKSAFSPKKSHYMTFNQALASPTISLYGRLVADGEAKPTDLGLNHPSDPTASLHRSVIFGYSTGDQCTTLTAPQQVWLPAPDGPADGCGWNGSEYVVWKNVNPDWNTLHVTAAKKPLSMVLAAGKLPLRKAAIARFALDSSEDQPGWSVRIISVVKEWAKLTVDPARNLVLYALWTASGGPDWATGQQYLAQLLDQRLGITIDSTVITQTMSIDGLLNLIG